MCNRTPFVSFRLRCVPAYGINDRAGENADCFRVIVMPHSHNDPGWLKTVEGYFATATKNILNNIVRKLTVHTNMTFIWSEVL